jgi:hypothetical protein
MKNTVKMLGIIAVIALIGFPFFSCEPPPEGEGVAKFVEVTGISADYNTLFGFVGLRNYSEVTTVGSSPVAISGGKVKLALTDYSSSRGSAYTSTGTFTLFFMIYETADSEEPEWAGTVTGVEINAETTTIAFSKFPTGDLSGTVSVSPDRAVTSGIELTANYSVASEAVAYQWKMKDGNDWKPVAYATSKTFIPSLEGDYRVYVYRDTYFKYSLPATIVTDSADFIGNWLMKSADNGNVGYNEIATISVGRFELRDDYTGLTPPQGKPNASDWDSFTFDIDTWDKIALPNPNPQNFKFAYKLTGTVSEISTGYTTMTQDSTTFNVYMKGTGTTADPFILRRTRGDKAASGGAEVPRNFVKQEAAPSS